MEVVTIAVLVAVFIGGFLLAGRWVKSIPLQLLLGAVLGVGIVVVLIVSFVGVALAGCLLLARQGGF
jgi:hypothetical protein